MPVLAGEGADQGPGKEADRHEEQPDDAADERAPQRLAAGTDPLRTHHCGQHVHQQREQGQYAQRDQGRPADVGEAVGPRSQQQSDEHQRDAGEGRKDDSGDADEDKNDR